MNKKLKLFTNVSIYKQTLAETFLKQIAVKGTKNRVGTQVTARNGLFDKPHSTLQAAKGKIGKKYEKRGSDLTLFFGIVKHNI